VQTGGGLSILPTPGVPSATKPTVTLGADNVLPSGFNVGGVFVGLGGLLDMNGHSSTVNSINGNGLIDNQASTSSTLTIASPDANSNGTFSGTIQNSGSSLSVVMNGAGTQTLSGANTYTGGTFIKNGKLRLDSSAFQPLGSVNVLPITTVVTLGDSNTTSVGTLDVNGSDQTIAALNTTGSNQAKQNVVNGGTNPATLTISGQQASVFLGNLLDNPSQSSGVTTGPLALAVTGGAQVTLGGTSSYTGGTTITGAGTTLTVTTPSALASDSDLTITDGGLILGAQETASGTSLGSGIPTLGDNMIPMSASAAPTVKVAPVPEPGTLVLLAVAAAGLALVARRRKK
jgi:autotransporter-associated beta strand protein